MCIIEKKIQMKEGYDKRDSRIERKGEADGQRERVHKEIKRGQEKKRKSKMGEESKKLSETEFIERDTDIEIRRETENNSCCPSIFLISVWLPACQCLCLSPLSIPLFYCSLLSPFPCSIVVYAMLSTFSCSLIPTSFHVLATLLLFYGKVFM